MPPLDASRFRLEAPPAASRGDAAAWRAAVGNAQAQLEHQALRLLNLELLLKYGPNTWRAQAQLTGATAARLEAELLAARAAADALCRERKLQQLAAGDALARAQADWVAAVRKNRDIQAACDGLEERVYALRAAAAPSGGIAGANPVGGGGSGPQPMES